MCAKWPGKHRRKDRFTHFRGSLVITIAPVYGLILTFNLLLVACMQLKIQMSDLSLFLEPFFVDPINTPVFSLILLRKLLLCATDCMH